MEKNKKERIWEIDFCRGIAVIMMAWDHLCWDLGFVFRKMYKNEILVKMCNWCYKYALSDTKKIINFVLCVGIFVFISGISTNLSHSNFKRGIKVLIVAIIMTLGSFIIQLILNQLNFSIFSDLVIYYGIFHSIGTMIILSPLFLKMKNIYLFIFSVIFIVSGIVFGKYLKTETLTPLIIFNIVPKRFATPDYVPLIPLFGVFILGMIFGKIFYKDKRSLLKKNPNTPILNFLGKHTLIIYFVHQIILLIILCIGLLIK